MNRLDIPAVRSSESVLSTNKLIKNTYTLLSGTLIWSALMAVVSMAIAPSPIISLVASFGALGLLWFVCHAPPIRPAGYGWSSR
jgi:modulator of FtsH protease